MHADDTSQTAAKQARGVRSGGARTRTPQIRLDEGSAGRASTTRDPGGRRITSREIDAHVVIHDSSVSAESATRAGGTAYEVPVSENRRAHIPRGMCDA